MVKKLIKYDFHSYLRLLLPVQLIVIGIAVINRIVQLFEPAPITGDLSAEAIASAERAHGVYSTVFISSLVLFIISILTCLLMTFIVAIVRFYQGLYTNEGYLNHTLPVTPAQHIWAKLLISLIFDLGSLFALFLSFMVITLGEVNIEVFKAFGYLTGKFFAVFGGEGVLYIVEVLLLVIVAQVMVYFKLYFCISLGQTAKKRKILAAFGVFFGIYVFKQIIGTIFIILTMWMNQPWITALLDWLGDSSTGIHILLWSGVVVYTVFSLIYFLITRYIMSKRLNLS